MVINRYQHSAKWMMRSAAAIAAMAFFGWGLDVSFLKASVPWLSAMNPATSISFILTVFSFHLLMFKGDKPSFRIGGYCIVALVILIASYRIMAFVLNLPLQIDLVLFQTQVISTVSEHFIRWMSALTSACFILISVALLTIHKNTYFSQSLALLVLAASFISLLGYFYQVPEFYESQPILPLVFSTSLCLLLISFGLVLSHSKGLMQKFGWNNGFQTFTTWAAIVIIPLILGYFLVRLHHNNTTSIELGIAMLVTSIIVAFTTVINYYIASVKHRNISITDIKSEPQSPNEVVGIERTNNESRSDDSVTHQNEINLLAIFESTDDLLMLVDKRNIIIQMNAKDWITWTRPVSIGTNVLDFVLDERKVFFQENLNRAAKGEIVRYEIELPNSGKSTWCGVSISRVKDGDEVSGFCITMHDLSSIKEVEISLRESEGRFRAMVENSTDVFTVRDLQQKLRYASPNVAKVLGYNEDEFRYFNPIDLIHPDDLHAYTIDFRRMEKQRGQQIELNIRMKHRNGRWIQVEGCVINLTEIDGIRGILSIFHDVTTRAEGQINILRLNKSLADFQNAIFQSSIVSRADSKGMITYVNQNFIEISGYSQGELVGSNHRIINSGFHPIDFWIQMWGTISSGKIWRQDVKNKSKTGNYYWVDTFVMPFVNDKGVVTEFLSIRNDITERKNGEEELNQNKLLLDKANEIANIGYWTYDPNNKQTIWNDQTLRIMGLPPDFSGGLQGYLHLIHAEDMGRVADAVEATVSHGRPFNIDHRAVFPDGTVRWLHEEAKVIYDDENKVSMILGIVQDISERKSVEEILIGYNEKFEILSKATNDAIYDWDMHNNYETWNHGFQDIFGYEHLKIADVKHWQRSKIHADDYQKIINDIEEYIDKKRTNWTGTYRYMSSNGGYKHVLDRGYIIYHEGAAVRMIGALQDITQRVESTAEIEKLSLVASKTSNGVTITDIEGRVEWVNDSFVNVTGYSFEEVAGQKMGFLQGPETDPITVKKISEQLKRREAISVELINYRKNGEKFWLKLAITPVFNDEGELKHFISIQSDISELKEFENSITSIARELTNLIENANVPIFGVDAQGNFNEWNHVTAELTRYSRNEMIGTHWSEKLFTQSSTDSFASMIKAVLGGIPISNLEIPLVTKKQKKLTLLLSASPRRNSKQEIMGVIIVAQNISELTDYRHNLEMKVSERTKALNEALNKERELVEMKSRLVSIASHEFRTPLATIAAATGLIRKHQSKLSAQDVLDKLLTVEKQVNHMSHMLDDVLLLDQANAGKMKVVKNELDLHEFVKNLSKEVVSSRGNTHRVIVTENLILRTVMSDEKILRSILINLLTNAMKFSPSGRNVQVSLASDADYFSISVKDFGIGIPESDLKNLFEPFFRGENANTIQGTGLGLSIIKKSVDLLSGVIVVRSEMNEGTEFTITIPISNE